MIKFAIALSLLSAASAALAAPVTLTSSLDGPSVTYTGDPDGSGSFTATLDPDASEMCYQLTVSHIGQPTYAHIHEGGAGEPGGPLVNLQASRWGEDDETHCINVSADVLTAIIANPSGYYVDVLTSAYSRGAVRGQLTQ